MRENLASVTVAGGSAGGVDHMYAGMLARLSKANAEQLQYKAFPGGNDVVQALLQKQVQVGISGYSEFRDALQVASCARLASPPGEPCSALPPCVTRALTRRCPTGVLFYR